VTYHDLRVAKEGLTTEQIGVRIGRGAGSLGQVRLRVFVGE
jgi:hypothetical protein